MKGTSLFLVLLAVTVSGCSSKFTLIEDKNNFNQLNQKLVIDVKKE